MTSLDTKYQIFLSSTYEDLKEERKDIVETILKLYNFPIGMEMFSADNQSQWSVIESTIDTSDVYILVIGHRYGSVTKKESISYTQKEFYYANKRRKEGKLEILCFIRDRNVAIEPSKTEDNNTKKSKLDKFIEEVKNGGLNVEWWKNSDDLSKKVGIALSKTTLRLNNESNTVKGWVRKNTTENQFHVIRQFLNSSAQDFEIVNDEIETYRVDKNGNCHIERVRNQLCLCDVTHGYTSYIPDKNGNSHIIDVLNLDTGNKLNYMLYDKQKSSLSFFILFDRVVKKGERIRYKSNAYVENYLSNLTESGTGIIGIKPYAKTSYSKKKDLIIFPDIKLFSNLSVMLIQKEVGKKTLEKITPITTRGNKIFTIDYGQLNNSCDIIVEFKLNPKRQG